MTPPTETEAHPAVETPSGATPPEPSAAEREPSTAAERLGHEAPPADTPEAPPDERDPKTLLAKAQGGLKSLEQTLARLLPSAAPGSPGGAPSYRPQPPMPPGPPVGAQPAMPNIPVPIDATDIDAAYQLYTNKAYDDRQAFHAAFGELFRRYHEKFIRQSARTLTRAAGAHAVGQVKREETVGKITKEIEGWWKSIAPNVPARLCWAYAPEAEQVYPGDLKQQALYCFSRALEEISGTIDGSQVPPLAHTTRAQAALIPGGEGAMAGRRGGEGAPLSMADQMRAFGRPKPNGRPA